jgi:hypothetical protein
LEHIAPEARLGGKYHIDHISTQFDRKSVSIPIRHIVFCIGQIHYVLLEEEVKPMNSREAQSTLKVIQKGLKERLAEDSCPDDFSWTQEIMEEEDLDPVLIERFLLQVEDMGVECDCELLKAIQEDMAEYKEVLLAAHAELGDDDDDD